MWSLNKGSRVIGHTFELINILFEKVQLQSFVTFYLLEPVKLSNWVIVFVLARQQ